MWLRNVNFCVHDLYEDHIITYTPISQVNLSGESDYQSTCADILVGVIDASGF